MSERTLAKAEIKKRRNLKNDLKVGGAVIMSAAAAVAAHPKSADAAPRQPKPNHPALIQSDLLSQAQQDAKHQIVIDRQAADIANRVNQLWPSLQVTKETVEGKDLRPLKSLPGFKQEITPEQQEKLIDSTVHIVYRDAGSQEPWKGWCTGTKISYGGNTYVLSAGHCFKSGLDGRQDNSEGDPSYDYINTSTREYGIVKKEGQAPFVLVTGLSMDIGDDFAMLATDVALTDTGQKAYDNIPALDFNHAAKLPTLGMEGVAHGYAQLNDFEPLTNKVRYLGRYKLYGYDKDYHYYDLVGIYQGQVEKSVCLPGDSGGVMEFANGYVSGPLTAVYDFGYKDEAQNRLSPFGVYPLNRYAFEQIANINLAGVEGICLLSVREVDNHKAPADRLQILKDGFSRPVPVYGKGGDPSGQG